MLQSLTCLSSFVLSQKVKLKRTIRTQFSLNYTTHPKQGKSGKLAVINTLLRKTDGVSTVLYFALIETNI